MEKRGWMRIVEASISILIILSVLFFLYNRDARTEDLALDERGRAILEELASDQAFRSAVVGNDSVFVTQAVAALIPETHLSFEARICDLIDVCGKSTFSSGNVYVAERVISSALNRDPSMGGDDPKKVRLFIWREMRA